MPKLGDLQKPETQRTAGSRGAKSKARTGKEKIA